MDIILWLVGNELITSSLIHYFKTSHWYLLQVETHSLEGSSLLWLPFAWRSNKAFLLLHPKLCVRFNLMSGYRAAFDFTGIMAISQRLLWDNSYWGFSFLIFGSHHSFKLAFVAETHISTWSPSLRFTLPSVLPLHSHHKESSLKKKITTSTSHSYMGENQKNDHLAVSCCLWPQWDLVKLLRIYLLDFPTVVSALFSCALR